MKERWATQLSRTPSKASARDTERHSTPSGSSLFTLAKLELHQYSATSTSRKYLLTEKYPSRKRVNVTHCRQHDGWPPASIAPRNRILTNAGAIGRDDLVRRRGLTPNGGNYDPCERRNVDFRDMFADGG
jgi:hypothetical protein